MKMLEENSRKALNGASLTLAAFVATSTAPLSARQQNLGDNLSGLLPSLSSLHDADGKVIGKKKLSPFTSEARRIDITFNIDVGKLAKEAGGEITVVQPAIYSDDQVCLNSVATFEGKILIPEKSARTANAPAYVINASSSSGPLICRTVGIIFYDNVTSSDIKVKSESQTSNANVNEKYVNEMVANSKWLMEFERNGLRRKDNESNYFLVKRLCKFMSNFDYGDQGNRDSFRRNPELMFDFKIPRVCTTSASFLLGMAANNGIWATPVVGLVVYPDGKVYGHTRVMFKTEDGTPVIVDPTTYTVFKGSKDLEDTFGNSCLSYEKQKNGGFIPLHDVRSLKMGNMGGAYTPSNSGTRYALVGSHNAWKVDPDFHAVRATNISIRPISLSQAAAEVGAELPGAAHTVSTPVTSISTPTLVRIPTSPVKLVTLDGAKGTMEEIGTGTDRVINTISISNPGSYPYSTQIFSTSDKLKAGHTYRVSFNMGSTVGDRKVRFYPQVAGDIPKPAGGEPVDFWIGTKRKTFVYKFVAREDVNNNSVKIGFQIGGDLNPQGIGGIKLINLWIEDEGPSGQVANSR